MGCIRVLSYEHSVFLVGVYVHSCEHSWESQPLVVPAILAQLLISALVHWGMMASQAFLA